MCVWLPLSQSAHHAAEGCGESHRLQRVQHLVYVQRRNHGQHDVRWVPAGQGGLVPGQSSFGATVPPYILLTERLYAENLVVFKYIIKLAMWK